MKWKRENDSMYPGMKEGRLEGERTKEKGMGSGDKGLYFYK